MMDNNIKKIEKMGHFCFIFLFFAQVINMKKKSRKKRNLFQSKNDPLGAYTGVPENPNDTPVQDADDL